MYNNGTTNVSQVVASSLVSTSASTTNCAYGQVSIGAMIPYNPNPGVNKLAFLSASDVVTLSTSQTITVAYNVSIQGPTADLKFLNDLTYLKFSAVKIA